MSSPLTQTVALIGRPNVGKSTLFNRLVRQKLALVDNQPGVTRDLREGLAQLGPLTMTILDTAGMENADATSLQGRMTRASAQAIESADICLFLFDARAGVCSADEELASIVRKRARKAVLVANKAESSAADAGINEGFSLGLGAPIAISAEHGIGMEELFSALQPLIEAGEANAAFEGAQMSDAGIDDGSDLDESAEHTRKKPLQIAIMGRPNVGKSTLINQILGEERLLTGPEAGITRDAIAVTAKWQESAVRIFDTAGMRRRAKVHEKLEKISVSDGVRAVRFAEVVILVLDAAIPFEQQDLRLADLAEREGRAVVVAINKWDCEQEKQSKRAALVEAFGRLLPQLRGAPMVPISAKKGTGLAALHRAVIEISAIWNRRISTARLNVWLAGMLAAHPPPAPAGRRIKIKFITQPKTRPPTFIVKASQADKIPQSYRRYLVGGLRRDFGLSGVPIRLIFKGQSNENPYRPAKPTRRGNDKKQGRKT